MTFVQVEQDGGEAARQLNDAHRQLLGDNSIQFELPTGGGYAPASQPAPGQQPQSSYGPGNPPPAQPAPQAAPPDPSVAPPPPTAAPEPMGVRSETFDGLMQVFLWVAAGIALAILLYWIYSYFRDRRAWSREPKSRRGRGQAGQEAWRPEEEQAVQLLDEADVLANEGRFDEAARLLLHRSIGEIDAHRPDLVRPALTSRDIAGHPHLPVGPAAAFARIAALVERSLFARRPLGPDDWQDCRAAYREFAFANGWQG